tara:strand:- start:656 stop:823 length:168 start_codon:yes stop_codon:yes gene_type:complete
MSQECPVCEGHIPSDETWELGELVDCPECGAMLEVVSLAPVKLEEAPEEDEDWGE